ncbi:hypothetical protein H6G33_09830 [Calothrix sp. FACHB-1219]|uniref:hypothetical protein n=1 Tax=unclassified Calothrix TaxID=2619626 RepID=UPI001686792B|nr:MULTISPECIES: hypothetical protein [unclassified Calothrix]MBD2201645.1 hypothetical protein [Calothrix sp. FACHB-168]MBD2217331.1 hypothetical protein [Calothrix sp. FACHB-1219]
MKSEDQYNRAQEKHHPIRSNFGNVLAVGIGLLLILFPLWGLQEANRRMEKPIKIELPNK